MCLKMACSLLLWRQWQVGEAADRAELTFASQPGGYPAVGHVTH